MEALGEEVLYDEFRWKLLREKRAKALDVLKALHVRGVRAYVFGSVARGDVKPTSDVDIVVLEPVQPYQVELALEAASMKPFKKEIVQATPSYVPKAYIYLDPWEEVVVSFPLARMRPREYEFYRWGGIVDLKGVEGDLRVPGVNKDLVVIVPTPRGHVQFPVRGHEGQAVRLLGVSMDIVLERLSVLGRRREIGRTGTFLKVEVPSDEPLEEAIARLRERNEFFRRATEG